MITLFTNILSSALHRQAAESELITAKELAEQSNHAKTTFLASISHEIRTPMNAILGMAEIQMQNQMLPADALESMNIIYDSGNLMINIINDILDFSKIEAGKMEITPAEYEMPCLLGDTVQVVLMRYDKPIEFKLDVNDDTPLKLIGDELRIKQILNNVLSNAFKYTHSGLVTLSVSTERDIGASNIILVLKISDTGQGMSENQLGRIFEEYSRFNTVSNRTTTGTGLGMAITKRLVDMMHGEILVESKPNEGSVFTIRLPQKQVGKAVCGAELTQKMQTLDFQFISKSQKTQIMREYMPYGEVLIVDDVISNIIVARGMMLPYGLKVDSCESGYSAIEKIKSGKTYDIIFMDHMMPNMDGIETVKLIRDMEYNLPIIALTANALTGQAEIFMQNGFDSFIAKPIDSLLLNTLLNEFIRDKQSPEVIIAARQEKETFAPAKASVSAEMLEGFVWDAERTIDALEKMLAEAGGIADIQLYTTTVHGIKSALANIGETELSSFAFKLEGAGRIFDKEMISAETPDFLAKLKTILGKYRKTEDNGNVEISAGDIEFLREKLLLIKDACATYDEITAGSVLIELRNGKWPRHIKEALNDIAAHLLHSEFKKVVEKVEIFCKTLAI
jgi:CheY-like chemotaxis protein/nitrogen-specific signal transduction histidine kinase